MKWLLVFAFIALITNAPTSSADDADEVADAHTTSTDDAYEVSPSISSESSSVDLGDPKKIVTLNFMNADICKVNTTYFGKAERFIRTVTPVYRALDLTLEVSQDLPLDTKVKIEVYGFFITGQSTFIGPTSVSFPLKDNKSQYYHLLPSQLTIEVEAIGFLQKGSYSFKDFGYFRFDELLTSQEVYTKYEMIFSLGIEPYVFLRIDHIFDAY